MQTSEADGLTWSAPSKVTTTETDETVSGADLINQYGNYNGLSGYTGTFFPSWTDRRSGSVEEIWTRCLRVPSLPQETCSADPILTSATISFHTNDDDKHRETYLIVDVNTALGEIAAHAEGFTIPEVGPNPFGDGKDAGPFSLLVNGPWFTRSRIKSLRLKIHPCGDETWNFNFIFDLTFSAGLPFHFERTGESLSDTKLEVVIPL